MHESALRASPNGRTCLQAKQFAAKYAVNICSAQENDFNCIIKLVVDYASGQNDWEEAGTTAVPLNLLIRGPDGLFAKTLRGPSSLPTTGVLRTA